MGKTSTACKNRWNAKNYERISLIVKIGQKELIAARADEQGKSVNGYIFELIKNDIGNSLETAEKE